MMPMMPDEGTNPAVIKVVGVGGGGGNTVSRMVESEVRGIEFITVNTDVQALERTSADRKIKIGDKLTRGLGAGGNPTMGQRAAEESSEQLLEAVRDADMVFIAAGMGGGTGTGAAPIVAQVARECGALTVAVVTKPFSWEGRRRMQNAEDGINALRDKVDALLVIPNDRILLIIEPKTSVESAFRTVDEVLRQGIQGIAEIIILPGLINRDFADVRTVMQQAGSALMAIGRAQGENRAVEAAKAAISSPLLDVSINGARGVLMQFKGGTDLSLAEISEAAEVIAKVTDQDAHIIFGAHIDPRLDGEFQITLIATGFDTKPQGTPKIFVPKPKSESAPAPAGQTQKAQPVAVSPAATQSTFSGNSEDDIADIMRWLRESRNKRS
jgi:cell division protein FtsZ